MKIICRARQSKHCYHGRDCGPIYGHDSMDDDGTFDGESVVCDACYIAICQPAAYPAERQDVIRHVDNVLQGESELGRSAMLVSDVIAARAEGSFEALRGSSDDDLLAAVEALQDAIQEWRER